MITLRIKLNNVLAFYDFDVNFSYPKKLSKSLIADEHLKTIPSFRYKKLVVLIGSNASGKTSLIKAIWKIALFLCKKDSAHIDDLLIYNNKDSSEIEIDFVNEHENVATLYRTKIRISYETGTNNRKIAAAFYEKKLSRGDSYENCVGELNNHEYVFNDWKVVLKDFPDNFGWRIALPSTEEFFNLVSIYETATPADTADYYTVLNSVMQTLDPAITKVSESKDAKDAIVVKYNNKSPVIIQNGNDLNLIPLLSSGTKHGIQIGNMIFAIKKHHNGLYLLDEQFSYVTSDIEAAILTTMTSLLNSGEQLFFTTHNSNILDLNFPFHSFYFMKKRMVEDVAQITITCASEIENRNNVSPKNMFDNDAFATAPNLDRVFALGEKENEQ